MELSTLNGKNGFTISGSFNDRSGYSVSGAGDINNDGLSDIIVGALQWNSGHGRVALVYGSFYLPYCKTVNEARCVVCDSGFGLSDDGICEDCQWFSNTFLANETSPCRSCVQGDCRTCSKNGICTRCTFGFQPTGQKLQCAACVNGTQWNTPIGSACVDCERGGKCLTCSMDDGRCISCPRDSKPNGTGCSPKERGNITLVMILSISIPSGVVSSVTISVLIYLLIRKKTQRAIAKSRELRDPLLSPDLIEFKCSDSKALGITVSPTNLSFGSVKARLEVDAEVHETIVVTGHTSKTEFSVVLPREDPLFFTMRSDVAKAVVTKGKCVEIDLVLIIHCTAVVKCGVSIVVEGKGFCTVEIAAESRLSTKLNAQEIEFGAAIGSGGFATVYRGRWRGTDVAIKSYSEGIVMNDLLRQDLDREVELCANLRNPFIV
jgi:hypothetical protein